MKQKTTSASKRASAAAAARRAARASNADDSDTMVLEAPHAKESVATSTLPLVKNGSTNGNGHPPAKNGHSTNGHTRVTHGETLDMRDLLRTLTYVRKGDFSVRLHADESNSMVSR